MLRGTITFDIAVQKQFTAKEKLHFQFRADAFNVPTVRST